MLVLLFHVLAEQEWEREHDVTPNDLSFLNDEALGL